MIRYMYLIEMLVVFLIFFNFFPQPVLDHRTLFVFFTSVKRKHRPQLRIGIRCVSEQNYSSNSFEANDCSNTCPSSRVACATTLLKYYRDKIRNHACKTNKTLCTYSILL